MIRCSLVFALLLIAQSTLGQLPVLKMCEHLAKCNEGSLCASKDTPLIFVTKMAGNDSISIYKFGADFDHYYTFLLLKDDNKYLILNGYSLDSEWQYLDKVFAKLAGSLTYTDIQGILYVYKNNSEHHQTPPWPAKRIKKNGRLVMDSRSLTYPPRKVAKTDYFFW